MSIDLLQENCEDSLIMNLRLKHEALIEPAFLSLVGPCYARLQHRAAQILHPREMEYFLSLPVVKRKKEYLLGRYAAKRSLAAIDDSSVDARVHIQPGVFQQPVVIPGGTPPLSVSISHSGNIAAAVAFPLGHPLGIDVEVIDGGHLEAMRSQIAVEELPPGCPHLTEAELYARVWTVKESLSKVLHCGLTVPFTILQLGECEMEGSLFSGRFRHFHQYRFLSLAAGGMAIAIVCPARTELALGAERIMGFLERYGTYGTNYYI